MSFTPSLRRIDPLEPWVETGKAHIDNCDRLRVPHGDAEEKDRESIRNQPRRQGVSRGPDQPRPPRISGDGDHIAVENFEDQWIAI